MIVIVAYDPAAGLREDIPDVIESYATMQRAVMTDGDRRHEGV